MSAPALSDSPAVTRRAREYFRAAFNDRAARVDRLMIWLLGIEWLGMMAAAAVISPRVWTGTRSALHPHLIAAVLAGPAFIWPAIAIARLYPARAFARHTIAVAQILVSILLIDCTGGRIETHFHVFGSLAFLAFYRDWRVLLTATVVTAADHIFRGIWWPQSVYGVIESSPWRWLEHAWWVAFEDCFLILASNASIREMQATAASKARLYDGSRHDVLTGIANRRLLQERFDARIRAAKDETGAILFVDLDRFKYANDTLGHTVGDKLLVLVTARLAEALGDAGTLARVGGDEFVALLDHISSPDEAKEMGDRFLKALIAPFHVDQHQLILSASIGISLFPAHGVSLATLQERADRAMYAAKSKGRSQCVTFSAEITRREEIVQEIARDLSTAAARGEFQLYFQPLVQRDGNPAGFEALLRWKHPVHGAIPPAEFIPLAEKSGAILPLGDWVLAEACRYCRTWQKPGMPPIGVAVNVSAVQFEQPDYPERVLGIVGQTGIDPALLTLELTEGVLVRDATRAREHLTRIRLAGIRIALDDFGTGYSSLSYITELPADLIKLDRSFITRELPSSSAVIESVVNLAHRLGLKVVAEGVETADQNYSLRHLMCDEFQGYYFSPPVPAAQVAGLLKARAEQPADPGLIPV